ncbi:MAG: hypothetical protein IT379_42510, partial [Deltaproteobacteria bacterium]|nr:hypothetical protein [Deltaproteobacteria bacterium]
VDPPPPDAGMSASPPSASNGGRVRRLQLVDQWRDTSPKQAERSRDLPFHDPPVIALEPTRIGERVHVRVRGASSDVGVRWEADGVVVGDGLEVDWTPEDADDQLRVAVRSRGGVAVVALRACEVRG